MVGGSRGSTVINEVIFAAKDELIKKGYQIILITGKKYYEEHDIPKDSENFKIISFTNQLIELMKKASLVISRSGATTLSEILGLRKISILIPSPNVTNNHQEKNADVLVKNKCAIMIKENELTKELLVKQIERLNDRDFRFHMVLNMIKVGDIHAREKFIKEMEMVL